MFIVCRCGRPTSACTMGRKKVEKNSAEFMRALEEVKKLHYDTQRRKSLKEILAKNYTQSAQRQIYIGTEDQNYTSDSTQVRY